MDFPAEALEVHILGMFPFEEDGVKSSLLLDRPLGEGEGDLLAGSSHDEYLVGVFLRGGDIA